MGWFADRQIRTKAKSVSNIAPHTVTDSCEDLSPVAVHKASAGGTRASIPDDSFSAGIGATNKVVVGWWVELLGAVFHHRLTHLAVIHFSRAAVLSSQIDEFYSHLITFAKNYCLRVNKEFGINTHGNTRARTMKGPAGPCSISTQKRGMLRHRVLNNAKQNG